MWCGRTARGWGCLSEVSLCPERLLCKDIDFEASCAFLVQFLLSVAQPHLPLGKTLFLQFQPHLGKARRSGKEQTALYPATSTPNPCPRGSTDKMLQDVHSGFGSSLHPSGACAF